MRQNPISVLSELGSHYEKADADKKLKLLGSIFPEMIEFDGEKCRTPSINEGLALCLNADKGLSKKRKGTLHNKLEVSPWVTRLGLEPRTLSLKGICSTNWAIESCLFLKRWQIYILGLWIPTYKTHYFLKLLKALSGKRFSYFSTFMECPILSLFVCR